MLRVIRLGNLERARRFERPTLTLARLCSTPELRPRSKSWDGVIAQPALSFNRLAQAGLRGSQNVMHLRRSRARKGDLADGDKQQPCLSTAHPLPLEEIERPRAPKAQQSQPSLKDKRRFSRSGEAWLFHTADPCWDGRLDPRAHHGFAHRPDRPPP